MREHFGAGVSICPLKWVSKEHDRLLLLVTTDFQRIWISPTWKDFRLILTISMLQNGLVQPHSSRGLPLSLSLISVLLRVGSPLPFVAAEIRIVSGLIVFGSGPQYFR